MPAGAAKKYVEQAYSLPALAALLRAETDRKPQRGSLIRLIEARIDYVTNWYQLIGCDWRRVCDIDPSQRDGMPATLVASSGET